MKLDLPSQIEAVLFFKGEPVSFLKLSQLLKTDKEKIREALLVLEQNLKERGLVLIINNESVMLGTSPEAGSIIEEITKEELHKDLGKAGIETLAIILYKAPVSKKEIDYIRGVNSSFIIRNLLIRGLVERKELKGERGYSYEPTTDLFAFMGLTKKEDLPEFNEVLKELENFSKNDEQKESEDSTN